MGEHLGEEVLCLLLVHPFEVRHPLLIQLAFYFGSCGAVG
jgi:hypothetical protein